MINKNNVKNFLNNAYYFYNPVTLKETLRFFGVCVCVCVCVCVFPQLSDLFFEKKISLLKHTLSENRVLVSQILWK